MKQLLIRKFDWDVGKAEELPLKFDEANVPFHQIDTVNWEAYPYCPKTLFRIAHNGETIFLNCRVNESDIKAVCNQDNGRIWEDSCIEFFISFDDKSYYNIECNCIGKLLIAKGTGRESRISLPETLIKRIDRRASLGDSPVENLSGDWEVSLIIPKKIFYPEITDTFDNTEAKGNFYKCGDLLRTPHYLSWNPVYSEKPNFHRPEFFGQLLFE